ncbi:MAG: hypothetical protein AB8G86_11585 [Saprospiraceae bacterium]
MGAFKKIKLVPNWKKIKQITYSVERKDFFRYMDNHRYPIDNAYELELKHLKNYPSTTLLEATYPKGILELLTSFQPYNAFIGKEASFLPQEKHPFSYTTSQDGQIKALTNLKQIHKYGFWLEAAIEATNLEKQEKKYLKKSINYFLEDEVTKQDYLKRDLEIIHEYYGATFYEDLILDLSDETFSLSDRPKKKKIPRKLRALVEAWNEDTKGIKMIAIRQDANELIIDTIWGINLFSIDASNWHDFSLLKKAFLDGDFDIERYHNITLHQKIYKYSLSDKILNFYSHKRRTVSDKMDKLLDVKIERKL